MTKLSVPMNNNYKRKIWVYIISLEDFKNYFKIKKFKLQKWFNVCTGHQYSNHFIQSSSWPWKFQVSLCICNFREDYPSQIYILWLNYLDFQQILILILRFSTKTPVRKQLECQPMANFWWHKTKYKKSKKINARL